MVNSRNFWCTFPLFLMLFVCRLYAGQYTLEVTIKNQPDNKIVLGSIRGDKFTPIDSSEMIKDRVLFTFSEHSVPGMYRLVMGKTLYAQIMDESPQQLDFIFNHEHMVFETDFKNPEDSFLVVLSEENRMWSDFRIREKQWQKMKRELEMDLAQYHQDIVSGKEPSVQGPELILKYNALQKERDNWITGQVSDNSRLFVSKMLSCLREPFLDGALDPFRQKEVFQNEIGRAS